MARVAAIAVSEKRGTQKTCVSSAEFIENWGIKGDAHAGDWHRQISLISARRIEEFRAKGADVEYGAFGENLVVDDIDFRALPVGTLLKCGEALLEITQIGKECHNHCAIYKAAGDCIMPREGVFARVVKGGTVSVGDEMTVQPRECTRYRAAVITVSDRCSRGEREDKSGPEIVSRLKAAGYEIVETLLVPDSREQIKRLLIRLSDQRQLDLILTTGGTGFAPRDVTPEATMEAATKNAPGIAEAIRAYSMNITRRAMLTRGVSVPGSPKACGECLDFIMDTLAHAIDLLRGESQDCGRT